MGVVFFANLFLAIGVMGLAVLDTIFHGQWVYLGEFVGLWIVMILTALGAGAFGGSLEESAKRIA